MAITSGCAEQSGVAVLDKTEQPVVSGLPSKPPLHFESNRGQVDGQAKFLSRGQGYTLFLTNKEAVLSLSGPVAEIGTGNGSEDRTGEAQPTKDSILRMRFVGANPEPGITGLEKLPGKINYFIGHQPANWRTNIPHYAKVAS